MRTWVRATALLAPIAVFSGGCREAGPADPVAFLKLSMQRMSAVRTYRAHGTWTVVSVGSGSDRTELSGGRTVVYQRPNRFRVVASPRDGVSMTCVCDGVSLLEYNTLPDARASTYAAPATIGDVGSMQMKHPMFCGSLLYAFLSPGAEPADVAQLAKGSIVFGDDATVDGVRCRTVKFRAVDDFGNATVSAGAEDGLVRRITYDSEPTVKAAAAATHSSVASFSMETVEEYRDIRVNEPTAPDEFQTKAPAGTKTAGAQDSRGETPKPPAPLGRPAPNLTVEGPDGRPARLSDFRGKVVFLDFWATWCPPCRESLPDTQKLHKRFASRGLVVLAITNEDRATAEAFCKANGYSFPIYTDQSGKASLAFDVYGIPTFAVVDRAGRLVSYYVGPQPPEVIAGDLVKAGLITR